MVYGSTLRLPGEFFTPSLTISLPDPSEFLNQLRTHFQTTSLILPRPTQQTTHIADGLSKATHVFVCHDAVRKPLQPPYDGPFPVVKRTAKHFTVTVNGRNDTVSTDRLKPAHLDTDHTTHYIPASQAQPSPSPSPTPTHTPTIPRSTT